MPPQLPVSKELAAAYAQKFWDAGNLIVGLMFSLAFGVYLVLVEHEGSRILIYEHICILTVLALIGNGSLGYLLYRLCLHEMRILSAVTDDANFIDSIQSGLEIRFGLLAFNTTMYLMVIWFVWFRIGSVR